MKYSKPQAVKVNDGTVSAVCFAGDQPGLMENTTHTNEQAPMVSFKPCSMGPFPQ